MNRRHFLKKMGLAGAFCQAQLFRIRVTSEALLLSAIFPRRSHGAGSVAIKNIRHWTGPDYTRVTIELTDETIFQQYKITGKIVVDLNGSVGNASKLTPVNDGRVKTLRVGQFNLSTARVVLDVDRQDVKVFTLSNPFRIVIDVKADMEQRPAPAKEEIPKAEPADKPKNSTPGNGKIRRIVIDPGHGGHDPGAVSANGTREKDIVLQIGLQLARKIREELGIEVVMTRSTDVFIELKERTAFANRHHADLFVSVHANASVSHAANGIETYYLNLAKTQKVAALAAKENGMTLEKVSVLQAVLFDLMANYKLNDSAHLADEVQKALYENARTLYPEVKNLGVKQGPFYVLVGATMPSILVEVAFVDHERDEQMLKDPLYQNSTADGIMEGIRNYIKVVR